MNLIHRYRPPIHDEGLTLQAEERMELAVLRKHRRRIPNLSRLTKRSRHTVQRRRELGSTSSMPRMRSGFSSEHAGA
jgi:hypothetical protein